MRFREILETKAPINLTTLFRQIAWEAFLDNLSENESELEQYVEDYEDDTGDEVNVPRQYRMQRGGELHDPAFAQWCKAKVIERADYLAGEIAQSAPDGLLTCWRAVEAPINWDPYRQHIGVHWSRDPDKAQPIFGQGKRGDVVYRVEAHIPLSSVDWDQTVKANLSAEFGVEEDEITLKPRGRYSIVKVERIDRQLRENQTTLT